MSKFKTQKLSTVKKTPQIPWAKDTQIPLAKKPKSSTLKKWIIGILIFLVSTIFAGTVALRAISQISLSGADDGVTFVPSFFIGTGAIEKIEGTKNILIAGIGWQWHEGGLLTDSLMLASINSDDGYVTLLSIPRDLFIANPKGYGVAGKINTLYGIGKTNKLGIKLLADKVSEITGQEIDEYIVIDFNWFKKIVDTLGGVEIDVPRDLVDREYPNNTWGYQVFSIRAWLQTLDGETALKYARSRHSTSDFDRSERQQLLLKGIKEKAFSLGLMTSPTRIQELFNATISNIDTSLTVGEAWDFAYRLKDIDSSHINIYNLSNDCIGMECSAGAYLYTPSREYFGGASVLIPENASATKLSYYEDIRRFSGFIFHFPDIRKEKYPISVIAGKGKTTQAKNIITTLQKLGINFDNKKLLTESTGSITTSHINIYRNEEADIGFSEDDTIVKALKFLEEKIPYSTVMRNEYITTDGPRIEIVIGNDIASYFTFSKPAYYLPYIAPTPTETSTASTLSPSVSGESTPVTPWKQSTPKQTTTPKKESQISAPELNIAPGEWETF